MKTNINIYIITSEHLKARFNHLNHQIVKFKDIFNKTDFIYNFIQINNPSHKDIEKSLDNYKDRVKINKEELEDNDFKKLANPLNTYQLSNFIKQEKAIEMIKNGDCNLNYIIEDDVMIIDEFIDNFMKLIEIIKKTKEFDLIFTSIAINQTLPEYKLLESFDVFKILIAKSSYFISKNCASKLFDYLQIIRFSYKIQLSYYIWENRKTIKSFVFNKNLLFEASKIGIFNTSVNTNNYLYQNGEYIKLTQIANNEYIDDTTLKDAENIYNSNGKNNPDFQHTMGLIYYKNKNYKKAKEIMIDAILNLKKNEGYISPQNELLNNCINMHQFEQSDIENVLKLEGIYS